MRARGSLVRRLVGLAALWGLGLLVFGAFGLAALYRSTIFRDVDDSLTASVHAVERVVEFDEEGEINFRGGYRQQSTAADISVWTRVSDDSRMNAPFGGRYWTLVRVESDPPPGRFIQVAQSNSVYEGVFTLDPILIFSAIESRGDAVSGFGLIEWSTEEGVDTIRARTQALALRLEDGHDYVIGAGADFGPIQDNINSFSWRAATLLAPFVLVLVAAVFLQVRFGLAPIFRMREAVADVREGRSQRLEGDAPAELAPLAQELNQLIDHNRDVVERARAHVGNLAHALKTPIAVLVNEARTADGELAELAARQAQIMSSQVDHHLKRASAAARAQSIGARTLVSEVVDDLVRTLPRMYPDQPIELTAKRPDELAFRGERQDLEEMVGNLMDNAFKWARGRVHVEIASQDAARLTIIVSDDGPGLTPQQRESAIRRGQRLDEAAPGSGLGLSIVDDLARAYGGRFTLSESELGGLAASLELPAASVQRRVNRG